MAEYIDSQWKHSFGWKVSGSAYEMNPLIHFFWFSSTLLSQMIIPFKNIGLYFGVSGFILLALMK